jgi:hypothetical protein
MGIGPWVQGWMEGRRISPPRRAPPPQAAVRRIQAEGPTGQVVLALHRVSGPLHLNSI